MMRYFTDPLSPCRQCHFLQRSLGSLDDAMEPFVDVSLNILSAIYSKEPHPQVLDANDSLVSNLLQVGAQMIRGVSKLVDFLLVFI